MTTPIKTSHGIAILTACLLVAVVLIAWSSGEIARSPALSVLVNPHTQLAQVSGAGSGLVGWWKLDEAGGTTASDSAGTNNGVVQGSPQWTTGALSFDGSSNQISISSGVVSGAPLSISAWVYPTGWGSNSRATIITIGNVILRLNMYSNVQFTTDGSNFINNGSPAVALNQWNMVTVTLNSSGSANIYVNGVLSGTANQSMAAPAAASSATIGAVASSMYFPGVMDDIRVYNRELSANEAAQIYSNGHNGQTTVSGQQTGDTTAPTISAVSASSITQTGATITWTTNEPATSQVRYGLTSSYGPNTTLDSNLVTSHSQTLTGLTSGTFYDFAVVSADSIGNSAQSSNATFTTTAATQTSGPHTYNVKQDGSGDFTTIQACASYVNLKPGDTCLVFPGTYNEHVNASIGGTSDSNRITFQAQGTATMEGFDINAPYVTVNGFDITGTLPSGVTGYITIYGPNIYRNTTGGNYCNILNNNIHDGDKNQSEVGLDFDETSGKSANNCVFTGNHISNLWGSGDNPVINTYGYGHLFENNDIENGNGLDLVHVFGHDIIFRHNIFRNSAYLINNHSDWVQTFGNNHDDAYNMLFEYNWVENQAEYSIGQLTSGDLSTGLQPNIHDWIFRNNVFVNIDLSDSVDLPGVQYVNNTFYKAFKAGSAISYSGNIMRGDASRGLLKNNAFVESGSNPVPNAYGGFYYIVGAYISSAEVLGNYISDATAVSGIYADLISNGYIDGNGIIRPKAKTLTDISQFTLNSTYSQYRSIVYSIVTQTAALDTSIRNTFTTDYNFVAGAQSAGFPAATGGFTETHGITGGDPKFQNISNPIGSDGIPFTADDGLQPLAGSPLCGHGENGGDIGAYACPGGQILPVTVPYPNNFAPPLSPITPITTTGTGSSYSLSVSLLGAGTGTVTGGSINCGSVCTQSNITSGTNITLTATPSSGSTFTGWSGGGCSGTGTCSLLVTSNSNVTATFAGQSSSQGASSLVLDLGFGNGWSLSHTVSDLSPASNNATCESALSLNGNTYNQCPSQATGPLAGMSAAQFTGSVCKLDSKYFAIQPSSSINNLSQGTLAVWAYYNPSSDPAFNIPNTSWNEQKIMDTYSNGTPDTWSLGKDSMQNTTFEVINDTGTGHSYAITFPDATISGSWHHYALTWDGTNFKGYYDGVLIQTAPETGISKLSLSNYLAVGALMHGVAQNSATNNCGTYYPTSVAANGYPSNYQFVMPNGGFLVGKLADIRIYNQPLSASNVTALYGGTAPVVYQPTTFSLSVFRSGTGSGTVTGGSISCGSVCTQSNITSGTQITLIASPSSGSTFTGWSGACSGTGSCSVTISSNTSVIATFTITTSDTTPPTLSAITTSNITTSGATISWTTSEAADTQVQYGLTTAYGSQTTTDSTLVTSHIVTLSNLTSNTQYHYHVISKDAAGNTSTSADYILATANASTPNTPTGSNNLGGGSSPAPAVPSNAGSPASSVSVIPSNISQTSTLTPTISTTLLSLPLGSRSSSVIALQNDLIQYGYLSAGLNTGYYGTLTQAAVARYRSAASQQPSASPSSTQYTFTRSLTLGSTGTDVKNLQIFLNTHGFTVSSTGNGSRGYETTYFGLATKAALVKFQEAHASAILTPLGLTHGTGNFGPSTMKVVNGIQ